MRNLTKKKIILISPFFLIFIILLLTNIYMFEYQWEPNDSYMYLEFGKNFARHNTLKYENKLNGEYNVTLFGTRGVAVDPKGNLIPTVQIGLVFLIGILYKIHPLLLFLLQPILGTILLIALYKISRLFLPKIYSLILIFLFLFFSPFMFNSSIITNNIGATAFFLLGLYYLLKINFENKNHNFILFYLFASLSMWLRYPIIIFYLPILIYYLINSIRKNDLLLLKRFIIFSSIFFIFFISFIIVNINLYDSAFGFINPENILRDYQHSTKISSQTPMMFEGWDILKKNLYEQIYLMVPIISILSILGFFSFMKNKQKLGMVLFTIPILQIFFYFGTIWGGYGEINTVWTSYQRYFLPSYCILFLSFLYFVYNNINYKIKKYIFILLIIWLFIGQINLSFIGLNLFKKNINDVIVYRENILQKTTEDSVIFFKINDKNIFPQRNTAIYQVFHPDNRLNMTSNIIRKLLNDNIAVYFANEDNFKMTSNDFLFNDYKRKFIEDGLIVDKIIINKKFGDIYHIKLKNED